MPAIHFPSAGAILTSIGERFSHAGERISRFVRWVLGTPKASNYRDLPDDLEQRVHRAISEFKAIRDAKTGVFSIIYARNKHLFNAANNVRKAFQALASDKFHPLAPSISARHRSTFAKEWKRLIYSTALAATNETLPRDVRFCLSIAGATFKFLEAELAYTYFEKDLFNKGIKDGLEALGKSTTVLSLSEENSEIASRVQFFVQLTPFQSQMAEHNQRLIDICSDLEKGVDLGRGRRRAPTPAEKETLLDAAYATYNTYLKDLGSDGAEELDQAFVDEMDQLMERIKSKATVRGQLAEEFMNYITPSEKRLREIRNILNNGVDKDEREALIAEADGIYNYFESLVEKMDMHFSSEEMNMAYDIANLAKLHREIDNHRETPLTVAAKALYNWFVPEGNSQQDVGDGPRPSSPSGDSDESGYLSEDFMFDF